MSENTNKNPEFVTFNVGNIGPTAGIFQLSCEQLKGLIMDVANGQIDGVQEVTYEFDRKSQTVAWYVWFNSNDRHFVDKTTENTAIQRSISRRSREFDQFASKFGYCEADDSNAPNASSKVNIGRILHRNSNVEAGNNRLIAVQISINPFIDVIFDTRGNEYKNRFHVNTPRCILRRGWIFEYDGNDKPTALIGIRIEKALKNVFDNRKKPMVGKATKF